MLNQNYLKKNSRQPPAFIKELTDDETFKKSVDYTLTKSRFAIISTTCSSLLTLILVLSGSLGRLNEWTSSWGWPAYAHGILYIFLISLIMSLFSLPFSLYSQFVIEKKFGFNKMTLPLFLADLLKSTLISSLITIPILILLFWFMDTAGTFWWLYAFGGITVFQLILIFLYPTLIAPLFNKFTPLAEGTFKEKIRHLAEQLHFETKGIFIMDGSKRSTHSNAYFTGLGRAKRIVLFDTLLKNLEEDQIVAVLAHEIGHEKKAHIKKNLASSLIFLLLGFWILSLLLYYQPIFNAFGFDKPSYHATLVLFMFFAGPFTFFINPLLAIWSRHHEYEADRFATEALNSGKDLKEALIRLNKKNLSNPLPHPLYSFYYYSHPALSERIKALDAFTKK